MGAAWDLVPEPSPTRASRGPTSTEGARSTFFSAAGEDAPRRVAAREPHPDRRRWDALVEVARVEDVVVGDGRVRRRHPCPAARALLLGRDDGGRIGVEEERE